MTGYPSGIEDRIHFVYELYAEDGTCLYVGCSSRPGTRLQWHKSAWPWVSEVATVKLTRHEGLVAGRDAEHERIQALNPTHNIHREKRAIPAKLARTH